MHYSSTQSFYKLLSGALYILEIVVSTRNTQRNKKKSKIFVIEKIVSRTKN